MNVLDSKSILKLNRLKQVMSGEWISRTNVCDEAIHDSVIAFTEEEVQLTTSSTNTVQELTVNSEGNIVEIWARIYLRTPVENSGDTTIHVEVRRDSTSGPLVLSFTDDIPPDSIVAHTTWDDDLADAGEHTYYLLAYFDVSGSNTAYAYNRKLGTVEHVGK